MLSNLASYLGYAAAPSGKAPQVEKVPTEVRLRAVEEDEWLLVERNENEGNASLMKKESDEDSEMTRVTLAVSTCPSSLPGSSKGLSRSASLDILCPLQESWYLTPPPSFTSEGPVHMETSPLENLLIEHPSMSVYGHSQSVEAPRKMSNSSPSSTSATEEEHPIVLMPIKERMYKLPRNKLNVKVSKKQSSRTSSPTTSPESVVSPSVDSEPDEKPSETKELKIKNFVKSPRRSINSELQNLPKKPLRKRPEASSSSAAEMISKPSDVIREEESPIVPNVQTRRLYSEVLASKPKVVTVQTPSPEPSPPKKTEEPEPEPELAPEPIVPETQQPAAEESESVMSVEEESSEEALERPEDRDRRKAVQTLPDRQHRLHFLNRSAQKVEQRKTCDLMKKNPLIRTNKARELNYRNKRQRRADMMQRHSGANNNRKCAKTSLY